MPIYVIESLVGDKIERRDSFAHEEYACELVCSYRGANGKSIYWAFRADHIMQLEPFANRMGLRSETAIKAGELEETSLAARAISPSSFRTH